MEVMVMEVVGGVGKGCHSTTIFFHSYHPLNVKRYHMIQILV